MNHLFQALSEHVDAWRTARYACPDFPAIGEILDFALVDPASDQLRYLRRAQFRALETYWYLRLVLNTPRIPDLYITLFPKPKDRREAMGLAHYNHNRPINSIHLIELRTDRKAGGFIKPEPMTVQANVTLTDVPTRKQDLVMGRYELPAPPAGGTVAVKVIDMLGEDHVILLKP